MNMLTLFLTKGESIAQGEGAAEPWRLNTVLHIVLAVGLLLFFAMLFFMLRRKRLILKYTLFWLLSGLVLLTFLIFPHAVLKATALIGVVNPVNAIFLLFAGVMLMLVLSLTSIVSQLSDKNRALVQSVALLEQRVRDMENKD
jgi:Uncharacterized conserved protein